MATGTLALLGAARDKRTQADGDRDALVAIRDSLKETAKDRPLTTMEQLVVALAAMRTLGVPTLVMCFDCKAQVPEEETTLVPHFDLKKDLPMCRRCGTRCATCGDLDHRDHMHRLPLEPGDEAAGYQCEQCATGTATVPSWRKS